MQLNLKPYLNKQIQLEENYYKELQDVFLPLIVMLNNYIESKKNISLSGVVNITNSFYKKYIPIWENINTQHAIRITQLAYNTLNHSDTLIPIQNIKLNYTKHLANALNIKTQNLFDTIKGRYIDLVPLGAFAIEYLLFNDESSKADLIKRCNNSITKHVQTNTTEGIISTIINEAKYAGATEYLPNNQHDDRVRPTHRKYFNGETWIKFNNPPPCGHVGTEYGCRCIIEAIR